MKTTAAGAPIIGKYDFYSGAWFSVSGSAVPSTTVVGLLQRLFMGFDTSGTTSQADRPIRTGLLTGAGTGRLRTFELQGDGSVTQVDERALTISLHTTSGSGAVVLPMQCSIAIGYKSADQSVRQRGRSRFWMSPLKIPAGGQSIGGGLKLSPAGVDSLTAAVRQTVQALAAAGWTLIVHGVGGDNTATEIYIDDIIDVNRTRRPWQEYQKRLSL